ncbi:MULTISPECIES: MFS transporter [Streptomyces]|jgi:metabolite-proton symporter|uniref:MFS transporter n=1 Tax=unclassified Streptomyces TaxID=2593676 RepID=UPI0008855323|nr:MULTISPECIES: MFS transporter [unclassified Streptomyces]MDX2729930.1 MFS transporter [Streptomyces sp. PA03-2a]MDX3768580.1 MFS transporter [Streptomyces sp. AK08-01B]MDX3817911.1 MFS transporter [Streptomyces sp. AK08-01A]SCZ16106.1 metabolite-proton symporter [Streptomyces sp. 136MFCol5.1]SFS88562.1 metabolite-proton symporter [Streptomyces sp. ok210]
MAASASAPPTARSLKRIVAASLIGTTIEWYDFFLYGSAAALVFPKLFFPESDPLVGTLLSFLTYAVGFAARPLGALVFGHYGDRLGRKKLLVLSLLLMGGATFAIGLLPTHATVGAAAPVLLTVLRLVQGFALGGEWGGAVLLVSEHGDAKRRGFWASWPQTGAPAGQLLATGVLSALTALLSDSAFGTWGWRIPFLLSGVLVIVGLWIRLSVDESPVFKAALAQAEARKGAAAAAEKMPLVAVLRHHWRDVLIAMGARMAENISYYVITAFILVYATTAAELSKQTALNAVLIASAIHFAVIPVWGALSDRFGRKPIYLIGAVGVGLWMFPFFALIDSRSFGSLLLAVTVGLIFHGAMYAPQAAFFSEMFATRMRYSGASIGAQFSSVAAGAPAPLIATALLENYHSSTMISLYVIAAALVTVLAVVCAKETRLRDLENIEAAPAPDTAAAVAADARTA